MTNPLWSCVVAALLAQDPGAPSPQQRVETGIVHYGAGRYEAALTEFAAAAGGFGAGCPPHVSFDLALAALRVQRTGEAETAARALLAADDSAVRVDGEYLLAMAAVQRSERAAAAARLPDAEPFAWDAAIRSAELSHRGFCRAVELRGAWPEALRNAERSWRRLGELQRLRADADEKRAPNPREKAPAPPAPPPASLSPPEETAPELTVAPLAPAEVARLLQRVQQREREKQSARQSAQRTNAVAGERDW